MIKKFLHLCKILSAVFLCFISFSCASTVNVRLTRPAQLDLNGAKTISVLPFKPCSYYREYDTYLGAELLINSFYQIFEIDDPDESALLNVLQSSIERGLLDSPYINLVNSSEVIRAQNKGQLNPADVYLTGEMTYFNVNDNSWEEKKLIKKAEGNQKAEYKLVTYWNRKVEFTFRYQVVDSFNNHVISYREIHKECISDSYTWRGSLPSAYNIAESVIRSASKTILKELQPYSVIKSIELLSSKTKDKILKERMKAADKLAADGMIKDSLNAFYEIYKETGLVEAGYNAAILTEALGNLSEAEEMMLEVYERHPDSRVAKGLSDIRYEINQANRLKQQINKSEQEEVQDFDDEALDVDF